MIKTKLNFSEILGLKREIYGIVDQNQQKILMEGLLRQKISFVMKYWLNDLAETVSSHEKRISTSVNELIEKYGEKDKEGNISVPAVILDKDGKTSIPNPKMIEFQKEYTEFMKEEKEIEHKEFTLDDLSSMTTEEDYPIFRKLIKINKDVKEA